MSPAEAQEVKNLLLHNNDQYRDLAERHHQLDDRLHELPTDTTSRPPNNSKKSP